ncbi:helix-turn-helix domain-containing protein [Phyllobacterium calauticae]|jgi:excisionase family DNA binding protein|uniref:helix-turn-helix domain-containing protein n=1 Tax=Phyllobacterium calauticae TaxID=2817027 RepID=UPI001CBB75B2|nr:helix-turn-helix domain-containing protein [Phyllobacterium calauticae]MBZ3693226.1 helix-turn-helix domain-containing protein [Phyllobacterium calauticae]
MDTKIAFTIDDFCDAYGIGRSYAYQQIKSGNIRTKKAGKRTLILRTDADDWLNALPDGQEIGEARLAEINRSSF